jgi:two-component SAPR family response regulator
VNDDLKIRCIVVDDEPFALKLMADDLSKIPYLELKETFSSPLDGLAFIRTDPIDLIFLDIQMPVLKGTELLRSLTQPPFVIFTTAFEQYALEGFELDVIDYLMKPIPFDRLLKAVNRVHQQISLRKAASGTCCSTWR